ncbi:hypothetical protein ACQY0O_004753 [Thecaphora frezii]
MAAHADVQLHSLPHPLESASLIATLPPSTTSPPPPPPSSSPPPTSASLPSSTAPPQPSDATPPAPPPSDAADVRSNQPAEPSATASPPQQAVEATTSIDQEVAPATPSRAPSVPSDAGEQDPSQPGTAPEAAAEPLEAADPHTAPLPPPSELARAAAEASLEAEKAPSPSPVPATPPAASGPPAEPGSAPDEQRRQEAAEQPAVAEQSSASTEKEPADALEAPSTASMSSPNRHSSPQTETADAEPSSPRHHPSDSSRHTTPATSTGEALEDKDRIGVPATPPAIPCDPAADVDTDATPKPRAGSAEPCLQPSVGTRQDNTELVRDNDDGEPAISTLPPAAAEPVDEIQPAYFYPIDPSHSADPRSNTSQDGVPVFEPTMEQFRDFYSFCQAIDSWGMRSGIIKVVPPKEWTAALPSLKPSAAARAREASAAQEQADEIADISSIRIRNAILQHFSPAGSGVWRQTNVTRTVKVWNAKQWADTCILPGQKGPEMERMKWKVEVDGVANGGWGPKKLEKGERDPHAAILEEEGVRTRSGKARPSTGVTEARSGTKRKRGQARSPAAAAATAAANATATASFKPSNAASASTRESPAPSPDRGIAAIDKGRATDDRIRTPKEDDADHDEEMPLLEGPSKLNLRNRPSRNGLSHHRQQQQGKASQASPKPSEPSSSPTKAKKGSAWAETTTADEWEKFDYERCWLLEGLSQDQVEQHRRAADRRGDGKDEHLGQADATPDLPALPKPSDWDEATCREIEGEYWRGLNFGKPPMYGADLKGTLFDDRTKHWNVGKLDNLLTRLRLRRKLPGVTTPYLYWGMWRATFAWHVEDMDLYSINYIHFGAPKQWYSIRQADRQRFESAMAAAFPSDSRRCPHFMRHKSYLASPSFLASHGIRPLRLVHNAGEFVITYPYGYHSGFNLGYNCAESVNFALDSWLDIGRKANYCHCDQAQQSVRMDVDAMLEESKELEEAERRRETRKSKEESVKAIENEEAEKRRKRNEKAREARKLKKDAVVAAEPDQDPQIPPKPPSQPERAPEELALAASLAMMASGAVLAKPPTKSVKGEPGDANPCVFCPSPIRDDLVRIPDLADAGGTRAKQLAGKFAHRLCASFIPETWVGRSTNGKHDIVCGVDGIEKARYSLKCQICPTPALQKMGAKIQCTRGRCPKSVHVSCALIEEHGWFIDVCPRDVADRLEAKNESVSKGSKKRKKSAADADADADADTAADEQIVQRQDEGEADDERLVVLCRSHNPLFKQAEEARKAEELRERILELPLPSIIKIKSSGGVFEATMTEVRDLPDGQGEVIIDDQGRPRSIKFGRILFDDKPRPVEPAKSEAPPEPAPEPPSVQPAESEAAKGVTTTKKLRKRAAAAATANAKAAKYETTPTLPEASEVQEPPAKRSRKATKRAEAAAANNAAADEILALAKPANVRKPRATVGKKATAAKSTTTSKSAGTKGKPTAPKPAPSNQSDAPKAPTLPSAGEAVAPQQNPLALKVTTGPMEFAGRGVRHAYHLAHPGAPSASAHQGQSAFPQFGQRYGAYSQPPSVLLDSRGGPGLPSTEHPSQHPGYRYPAAPTTEWQQQQQQPQQHEQQVRQHAPLPPQPQPQAQHARYQPVVLPMHYKQGTHEAPLPQSSPLPPSLTSRASSHSDSAIPTPVATRAGPGIDYGSSHGPGYGYEANLDRGYGDIRSHGGDPRASGQQGYAHNPASHPNGLRQVLPSQYLDSYQQQERRVLPSYRENLVQLPALSSFAPPREQPLPSFHHQQPQSQPQSQPQKYSYQQQQQQQQHPQQHPQQHLQLYQQYSLPPQQPPPQDRYESMPPGPSRSRITPTSYSSDLAARTQPTVSRGGYPAAQYQESAAPYYSPSQHQQPQQGPSGSSPYGDLAPLPYRAQPSTPTVTQMYGRGAPPPSSTMPMHYYSHPRPGHSYGNEASPRHDVHHASSGFRTLMDARAKRCCGTGHPRSCSLELCTLLAALGRSLFQGERRPKMKAGGNAVIKSFFFF